MSRFILVDPQLSGYHGHHFEYCQSVAEAARRQGFDVTVYSNRKFSVNEVRGVTFIPWFRLGHYSEQPGAWRVDLQGAIAHAALGANDHLYIHTIYMDELRQLQAMLFLWPPAPMPHIHVMLRRDLNEYGAYENYFLSSFFRRLNRQPRIAEKMHFYGDTPALCAQSQPLADACGKTVACLPIPFRHELLGAAPEKPEGSPVTVVYLGGARLDKGYHRMPQAIEFVLRHLPKDKKIEFILQSEFNVPGGEKGIAAAREKLMALPHVRCPEGPFAPEDYYALLQQADIILLPYNAVSYRRVSSGILSEAVAAGKVVVVPAHSWLSSQVDHTRAVTFSTIGQLGPALGTAIDRLESLQKSARAYRATFLERNTPDILMRTMIAQAKTPWQPAAVLPGKRSALLVTEGSVLDGMIGAGRVGHGQLRYLQEQGMDVQALVCLPADGAVHDHVFLRQKYETAGRALGLSHMWYAWLPSQNGLSLSEQGSRLSAAAAAFQPYQGSDMESDLWVREHLYTVDPALQEVCRAAAFDFVLVNYAHNLPLLKQLDLKGAPVLCETHDNMALNKAESRGQNTAEADEAKLEIAALSACAGAIFLNEREEAHFRAALPATVKTAHLITSFKQPYNIIEALAGCINMTDVAQAAGIIDAGRVNPKTLSTQFDADLLFISSNHLPAVKSLEVFYKKIFVPHLKPRQIRLTCVGSVGLGEKQGFRAQDEPLVEFVGRMNDLSPFYGAAKLVIQPIFFGTGLGIKTIEALGYNRPMLGTPLAFRGFDPACYEKAAPLIAHTPEDYAEKIIAVLENKKTRQENLAAVQATSKALPSWQDYSRDFSALLSKAVPEFDARPPAAEITSPPGHPFDFDADFIRFNLLMRVVMLNGAPGASDCRHILSLMADPQRAAFFREVFDAFFISRSALLAKALEKGDFFMEAARWSGISFDDFIAELKKPLQAAA